VIGGLASSLALTLLLVPVVYVAFAPRRAGYTDGEGDGPSRLGEREPSLFDAPAR